MIKTEPRQKLVKLKIPRELQKASAEMLDHHQSGAYAIPEIRDKGSNILKLKY